ncbi:MAG: flagellar basal-body rod protein FlgF [Firmicutes bacterium]|nr:flagellar basal-body rod protein FlgF [Bacillota bacterium]
MIKGLYTAASSMLANQNKMSLISNNLANVNTTGYKKDEGIQESFPEMLISRIEKDKKSREIGSLGTGTRLQETYTDLTQGSLYATGNELDLAIDGDGYFVVETPEGIRYTRNGNFTLNDNGQIVTNQGYLVMGEEGPMQTISGRNIQIDGSGQLYLDNLRGDNFLVVNFPNTDQLTKIGDNLYTSQVEGEEELADFQIRQGYLENSNVNVVQEMVKMIETNRYYTANQKVITAYDSTLDKVVNSVGSIG